MSHTANVNNTHRLVVFLPFFGDDCVALSVYDRTPSVVSPSSVCSQPGRPVSRLMDEQQQHGAVQRSVAQGRAPLSHTLIPPHQPLMTEG